MSRREEEPILQELRINERIRAAQLRLISEDGQQVGVIPREDALTMAREKDLDLVEVAPDSSPPVCRLMDYGKHKYRQKKKEQQSKQKGHQQHLKEVRLSTKIEPHDVEVKLARAREFLDKKDKVLISLRFRGRETQHSELGFGVISQFLTSLEDIAKVERAPRKEGARITAILTPKVS